MPLGRGCLLRARVGPAVKCSPHTGREWMTKPPPPAAGEERGSRGLRAPTSGPGAQGCPPATHPSTHPSTHHHPPPTPPPTHPSTLPSIHLSRRHPVCSRQLVRCCGGHGNKQNKVSALREHTSIGQHSRPSSLCLSASVNGLPSLSKA